MIAVLPVSADTTVPVDIHDLDYDRFLEEVHSFEFWFEAVSGYLTGLTWGHRPGLVDRPRTPEERERLVTVLCNYCVGEAAALEGASGLVAIAPNRLAKVFLATQVVDEGRHLEIFYHRLRQHAFQPGVERHNPQWLVEPGERLDDQRLVVVPRRFSARERG